MAIDPNKVNPIHQFEIGPVDWLGGVITNSGLFMVLTVAVAVGFLMWSSAPKAVIPGRAQSLAELSYEFVAKMLKDSAGSQGMKFFPLVFSLFMFVLIANLFGMVPGFFAVSSQIIVTFALAMLVILTVVIYGIWKHGLHFFGLFVPSGVPMVLIPLVTAIEVISFLSRPISLSVRLFANILAGHITLKVFAGFVFTLGTLQAASPLLHALGIVGAILPLVMTVALTALEFLVAFLQAYVFAVLTCMYLNDALHPGH